MIISDLSHLEVFFEETSIVGGTASASAKANSFAKGANNAFARSTTRTLLVSSPGNSFSASQSKSEALAN